MNDKYFTIFVVNIVSFDYKHAEELNVNAKFKMSMVSVWEK